MPLNNCTRSCSDEGSNNQFAVPNSQRHLPPTKDNVCRSKDSYQSKCWLFTAEPPCTLTKPFSTRHSIVVFWSTKPCPSSHLTTSSRSPIANGICHQLKTTLVVARVATKANAGCSRQDSPEPFNVLQYRTSKLSSFYRSSHVWRCFKEKLEESNNPQLSCTLQKLCILVILIVRNHSPPLLCFYSYTHILIISQE